MKVKITQTRQINPYEPRKIEIEFDTERTDRDWEEVAQEIVDSLDYLLYPENHVEFHQDPPSEIQEPDEF